MDISSSRRLYQIANASDEVARCVQLRGSHDPEERFGITLGELDWLTELHRLLYEDTNENF